MWVFCPVNMINFAYNKVFCDNDNLFNFWISMFYTCKMEHKCGINSKLNEVSKTPVLSRWLLSTVVSIHVIYSPKTQ